MIVQFKLGVGLVDRIDKIAGHRGRSAWVADAMARALKNGFRSSIPVDVMIDSLGERRRVALNLDDKLVEEIDEVTRTENLTRSLYLVLAVASRFQDPEVEAAA